ncbi:hypothetical protein V7068_17370 [Bacillus sp. JJ634]
MARDRKSVGFYPDNSLPTIKQQGVKPKEEPKQDDAVEVTTTEEGTKATEEKQEKTVETPVSEWVQNIHKDNLHKLFPCNIKLPGYMNIPLERYIAEEKENDTKMYDFILNKERKINKSAIFAEAMKDWLIKKGIVTEEELNEFAKGE